MAILINELKVGNLFRFISTDSIERVADMRTAGIKTPTINNVQISDCDPIQLNEDWLVKFGFENVDDEIDYSEFVLNYVTIEGNGSDKQEPFHFVRDVDYRERKTEIKYVHQLQNLYFALTGTELTPQRQR